MRRSARIAAVLAAALPGLALGATSTWQTDPAHTQAIFGVRYLVISTVRGGFGKISGTLVLDESDVTRSRVEATIDATTVDTGVAKRDEDLRSPNFLDVAKYPTITFKSTKVEKAGEGKLKVTGDLTIHGVTRSVTLDVAGPTREIKDPWGNVKRGVSATCTINRRDFGLISSKTIDVGPVVGDEVAIEIESQLIKAK